MHPQHRRVHWAMLALSLGAHAMLLAALPPDRIGMHRPHRSGAAPTVRVSWVRPQPPTTQSVAKAAPVHGHAARAAPARQRGTDRALSTAAAVRARRPDADEGERRVAAHAAPAVAAASAVSAEPAPIPAPVAVPPREALGAVFALPRIGLGALRMPAATRTAAGGTAMQAAMEAQRQQQAAAALNAARAHLHTALQRQLGAWPPLDSPAACRVSTDAADCDHDALRERVLAHADELHALLAVHRRIEPLADALQIEYRDGRYSAALQWQQPGSR